MFTVRRLSSARRNGHFAKVDSNVFSAENKKRRQMR